MVTPALDSYQQKKQNLIAQLKNLNKSNAGALGLQKNTSNLFRARQQNDKKIDVRSFNNVISIDPINLIAEVEGMTTYEDFVNACLKHSCLPTVVPELKSITVGGALSGGAIESSSFRYGLVHETILEFEALLSDGQVVICRPDNEHRDLFYGFPNSYGTLGYALKIKIKIIPAKKFVKLTHLHFTDAEIYFAELNRVCHANQQAGSVAYVDGVVFDKNNMYLTLGEFVDAAPYVSDYKYLNIYYRSIQKNNTDYLTALDYIWRWDSDWFWCSKFFFMQNFVLRLLLGKFLLKSTAFWKIRHLVSRNPLGRKLVDFMQKNTEAVIQDVQVPVQSGADFLNFFQDKIGIKPIWVCPTMPYSDTPSFVFYPMAPDQLYINFGFWDVVPTVEKEGHYNMLVEDKVRELDGYKGLYSNVYYTEDEFWNIYNKTAYSNLKNTYDAQSKLKNLYQKCTEK